ncbi:hypothetical protein [Actinomadura rudentiformis]|uniref:Uncharacterized protein n=1 Tax=Actinomadura rudentiformis TaxID=359158 RepID=A0A6H9YWX7_9ACTN|nr:hypothetical protein [Actinomadura rudentiformis]KAB2349438.1 hypothetical protein F8566_11635 [Actinomadura rudentiformis]
MRAPRRAACLLLGFVAAAVVAYAGRTGSLAIAIDAALTLAVVAFGLGAVRVSREIREQQRRIMRQLDIQTRVVHNAARLAAECRDEPTERGT